ncbi:MAG TPA: c-type cytochrome [Kofleriaceae bacterium]|nr:c-type cytochrome [Kofleriaceae bacterium]
MIRFALLALLLFATSSCEREERTYRQSSSAPVSMTERRELVPGNPPAELGQRLDPRMPGYAETAYALSEGRQLYNYFNCVGCHAKGGGAMGPALIDDHWAYGSAPFEVATSIVEGRPNGMPSFRNKVTPLQVYQLVAYVRSLGNLVRFDARSARDDHMKLLPSSTLEDRGLPVPGKERP